MTTAATIPVEGAVAYRFSAISEGTYASRSEGTVVVDGKRWRINYDAIPERVPDLHAIVGSSDGGMIALNDEKHTWFRLPSRKRLAVDSSLFSFGEAVRVSKLKISSRPLEQAPTSAATGGPATRITFSYRIETRIQSERVRGEVWGEIRVQTRTAPNALGLPWNPVELRTGLDVVDEALRSALEPFEGTAWQCEIEVSRRLEGGAVLKQSTRRTISPISPTNVDSGEFGVPPSYEYQEPVIGAASATPPM